MNDQSLKNSYINITYCYLSFFLSILIPKLWAGYIDVPYVLSLTLTGLCALFIVMIISFRKVGEVYVSSSKLKNYMIYFLFGVYGLAIGALFEDASKFTYGLSTFFQIYGSHDAVFHSALTASIAENGYPSLPVNGFQFYPYHSLSDYIYAFNLKFISPISAEYSIPSVIQLWLAPLIPLSVYFFAHKFNTSFFVADQDRKPKMVYLLALSILLSVLVIYFEFKNLTLRSESMALSVILTMMSARVLIFFYQFDSYQVNRIDLLYISILLSLMLFTKSAAVLVILTLFGFALILRFKEIFRFDIGLILIFGLAIFVLTGYLVSNPFQSKEFEFLHFFLSEKCHEISVFGLYIIVLALVFSAFSSIYSRLNNLHNLFIYSVSLFASILVASIPVVTMKIQGCSAIYILLPILWLSVSIALVFLYRFLEVPRFVSGRAIKGFIISLLVLTYFVLFDIYSSQVDKNSKKILKRYSDTAEISDRGYFTFIHPKSLDGADNYRDWIELNEGANFSCRTAPFKYFLSTGRSAEILNPSLKCSYPGISYDR